MRAAATVIAAACEPKIRAAYAMLVYRVIFASGKQERPSSPPMAAQMLAGVLAHKAGAGACLEMRTTLRGAVYANCNKIAILYNSGYN